MSTPVISDSNRNLLVTVAIVGLLALIAWNILKRIFSGIGQGLGLTLDPKDQATVDARKKGDIATALYERADADGIFAGSQVPLSERQYVTANRPFLQALAYSIANARGAVNDKEEVIAQAFRPIRSLYQLLWLNRYFAGYGGEVWNPGDFDLSLGMPQLGDFLDATISDAEWLPIMEHVKTLPKFDD